MWLELTPTLRQGFRKDSTLVPASMIARLNTQAILAYFSADLNQSPHRSDKVSFPGHYWEDLKKNLMLHQLERIKHLSTHELFVA